MDADWSVRRFAALDMYGTTGTLRRRRIVTAEFVLGTVGAFALAALLFANGAGLWAAWALGCGANYAALAAHAISLYPHRRLESELDGVDVRSELRRYGIAQLLLFIPALIAFVGAAQALRRS